jgi:2',3'-cyclic-nucleotide 2'-phosphodiesterase (5'-nucleotidase family)
MMQRDEDERTDSGERAPGTERGAPPPVGGFGPKTVAVTLLLAAVLTFGGVLLLRMVLSGNHKAEATPKTEPKSNSAPPSTQPSAQLFRDWSSPEVVLLLTGQQHGYVLPCGCSTPQYGGLERRYNFLQALKARGWPVVALDLGDIAQNQGPQKLPNVQGLQKYIYSMEALKRMDYAAVGIGEYEIALPLKEALDNYALNEPQPRVLCANLKNLRAKNNPFEGEVEAWKVVDDQRGRVDGSAARQG